ncbi:hypothetical protein ACLK1Y_12285 [Escherichia coli]
MMPEWGNLLLCLALGAACLLLQPAAVWRMARATLADSRRANVRHRADYFPALPGRFLS